MLPSKIVVRACEESDYMKIWEINKLAFGYEYPLERTKQRLAEILKKPTDKIYVACISENVVGYIHASDYECTYSDSLKNIMAIAVDENYRNLGVGKKMLTEVEEWAKSSNCKGVRLVSGENRAEAHKFYSHCGYSVRKMQKNFIKLF